MISNSKFKSCKYIFVLLILILLIPFNSLAFGVSTPYFENNIVPLELDQEFEYVIFIQNGDSIDFDVNFSYSADSDVAKLRPRDNFIKSKTYENEYIFDVKLPNTSLPGDVYVLNFNAYPILEGQGQVPMTVQIKRSVSFVLVEEGGVGVSTIKLNWFQRFIYSLVGLIERIYVYLIVVVLIGLIYLFFNRILLISKSIAKSLTRKRSSGLKADDLISKVKNIGDLSALIRLMSEKDFDSFRIRQLISNKLEKLGKKKLSAKVMSVKSKSEILRLLRKK